MLTRREREGAVLQLMLSSSGEPSAPREDGASQQLRQQAPPLLHSDPVLPAVNSSGVQMPARRVRRRVSSEGGVFSGGASYSQAVRSSPATLVSLSLFHLCPACTPPYRTFPSRQMAILPPLRTVRDRSVFPLFFFWRGKHGNPAAQLAAPGAISSSPFSSDTRTNSLIFFSLLVATTAHP